MNFTKMFVEICGSAHCAMAESAADRAGTWQLGRTSQRCFLFQEKKEDNFWWQEKKEDHGEIATTKVSPSLLIQFSVLIVGGVHCL